MLNVYKFDDINFIELHNEELDEMINRYYNDIQNTVIDKYNLSKELYAIIQFQDNSIGCIDDPAKYSTIYELYLDENNTFKEGKLKVLSDTQMLQRNKYIDQWAIASYNLKCTNKDKRVKRIFTEEGYSEF